MDYGRDKVELYSVTLLQPCPAHSLYASASPTPLTLTPTHPKSYPPVLQNDRAKVEQGLLRRDEREGSNKSRNPSGAPVRRTIPTGSLSAKFGSEAKSNVKGKG